MLQLKTSLWRLPTRLPRRTHEKSKENIKSFEKFPKKQFSIQIEMERTEHRSGLARITRKCVI